MKKKIKNLKYVIFALAFSFCLMLGSEFVYADVNPATDMNGFYCVDTVDDTIVISNTMYNWSVKDDVVVTDTCTFSSMSSPVSLVLTCVAGSPSTINIYLMSKSAFSGSLIKTYSHSSTIDTMPYDVKCYDGVYLCCVSFINPSGEVPYKYALSDKYSNTRHLALAVYKGDYSNVSFVGSNPSKELTYNSGLGYLKNLSFKTLFLYGDNYSTNGDSAVKRMSYDKLTTTGIDLTQGDYSIRIYEQIAIYDKHGKGENCFPDLPMILVDEFPASELSHDMNSLDAFNKTTEETGSIDGYNAFTIVTNGYNRSDTFYYQIVSDDYCGGYVRVDYVYKDGADCVPVASTIDNSGKVDEAGYTSVVDKNSSGVGSSYEEADFHAESNQIIKDNSSASGVADNLDVFTKQIGNIPLMIGIVYSFLPPWCLAFVGFAFSAFVAIMVIKMVRG